MRYRGEGEEGEERAREGGGVIEGVSFLDDSKQRLGFLFISSAVIGLENGDESNNWLLSCKHTLCKIHL